MTEKDPFYEDPMFQKELDEVEEEMNLDEMLEQIENEPQEDIIDLPIDDRDPSYLSIEEEKQLKFLLDKKAKEDQILKTFAALETKPTEEQLAAWRTQFGDVYLVSLSEKENFIFRALKRLEWSQLLAAISKLPEAKKTDAIAMKGVVWPKLTQGTIASLTAGAPETLRALIFEASNFIEPERAIQLVRKL